MRHCATCEKPFSPRQGDQRFCCDLCRWRWHDAEKTEALRVYRELVRQHSEAAE
jgi:hypothetical protein